MESIFWFFFVSDVKRRTLNSNTLKVDLSTRRVWKGEQALQLTKLEYEALEYLARRAGQMVTYQELWRDVWRHNDALDECEQRAVRQVIKRLRQKMGEDWRAPQVLVCVRGVGFSCRVNHITLVE